MIRKFALAAALASVFAGGMLWAPAADARMADELTNCRMYVVSYGGETQTWIVCTEGAWRIS